MMTSKKKKKLKTEMSTRAIVLNGSGGPELFSEKHVTLAELGALDLLIDVKASASNPVDIKARKSNTTPDRVVGFDGAGVVKAVGKDVTRFKPGDRVFWAGNIGLKGSFAEHQVVDSRIVGHAPASLDFAAAAAWPLVALTAWEPLFESLRLPLDGSASKLVFLFIGGAGGVGSAAIQVAKHVLKSEIIIASASRPESAEWCKKLGATHVVDHTKPLKDELARIGVAAVDIAFCGVDLDKHYDAIVEVARCGSHIIGITFGDPTRINVAKLFWPKRLTLTMHLMFGRPVTGEHPELQGQILDRVAKLIDEKKFVPIDHTHLDGLTVENVRKAQELQESGAQIGKIVLKHQ